MWSDIRQEIERVRRELELTPAQFQAVGLEEWLGIEQRVRGAFTMPNYRLERAASLWTQLRPELPQTLLRDVEVAAASVELCSLRGLWQPAKPVFFFAQEGVADPKIWWYRADSVAAWAVVEQLGPQVRHIEEWGMVDRQYGWALFITHADELLFCGTALVDRLRCFAQAHHLRIE